MVRRADHEHFPEIMRQLVLGAQIIDHLADGPMLGHRDQLALHQPPGGLRTIIERFLDRRTIVGLHRPKHRALLVLLEVLDQRDRVVGIELRGQVGDPLRVHLVDQPLADVLVHLREHIGVDQLGERRNQSFAFVGAGKFDQVGDVGRVKRRNQRARGLDIAGLDRVQHLVDEARTEPVLRIHHTPVVVEAFVRSRRQCLGGGAVGDGLALAHRHFLPGTCQWPPMAEPALAQGGRRAYIAAAVPIPWSK